MRNKQKNPEREKEEGIRARNEQKNPGLKKREGTGEKIS